jgi:hypothetical protein
VARDGGPRRGRDGDRGQARVGGPEFVLYTVGSTIDPSTALGLAWIGTVSFMIFLLPVGLFVACGAAAAMITGQLGRVLGWSGVLFGLTNIVAAVVTGPRIENGFAPTFLLLMLWTLVVSVVWGVGRRGRMTAPAVEPAPAVP